MTIGIPDPCLAVLIGVTGSGKSTFAAKRFAPTEVLSSDLARDVERRRPPRATPRGVRAHDCAFGVLALMTVALDIRL